MICRKMSKAESLRVFLFHDCLLVPTGGRRRLTRWLSNEIDYGGYK